MCERSPEGEDEGYAACGDAGAFLEKRGEKQFQNRYGGPALVGGRDPISLLYVVVF